MRWITMGLFSLQIFPVALQHLSSDGSAAMSRWLIQKWDKGNWWARLSSQYVAISGSPGVPCHTLVLFKMLASGLLIFNFTVFFKFFILVVNKVSNYHMYQWILPSVRCLPPKAGCSSKTTSNQSVLIWSSRDSWSSVRGVRWVGNQLL